MNKSDNDIKKCDSREALLKAAEKLFTEKSYAAVSTRDIAELAGVNLGAIQYHFGSKAKLFVETVNYMMQGSACFSNSPIFQEPAETREEAVYKICEFVVGFLGHVLSASGPQPCRLMFREILSDTSQDPELFDSLVTTVVRDFTGPVNALLCSLLRLVKPSAGKVELDLCAQSILGQCSFYISHRPFIERLQTINLADKQTFRGVVEHICSFSLKALNIEEILINNALEKIFINRGK